MPDPIRLLMVEDSPDGGLRLEEELRRGGFEPAALRVGREPELVAALDQGPWDLLLLADRLPHLPAERALEILRQRQLDLPAIVVAGTAPEEELVRAMRSGARD